MKSENISLLNRIIRRKSTEFRWQQEEKSPQVVPLFAPREEFHLFIELDSPVVPPLPLQMSIQVEEDAVRSLMFPSPRLLTEQTAERFLSLSNEANRELYRGAALGRFWVDIENLDFAYELILKESIFESNTEEIAAQLFDVPLAHFRDLHIPLVMQAGGIWDCDTALRYFQQLRREGYVENRDFGLW